MDGMKSGAVRAASGAPTFFILFILSNVWFRLIRIRLLSV